MSVLGMRCTPHRSGRPVRLSLCLSVCLSFCLLISSGSGSVCLLSACSLPAACSLAARRGLNRFRAACTSHPSLPLSKCLPSYKNRSHPLDSASPNNKPHQHNTFGARSPHQSTFGQDSMAGHGRTGQDRTSRLIASPIYVDRAVKYSSTVHAEQAGEAEGLRQSSFVETELGAARGEGGGKGGAFCN